MGQIIIRFSTSNMPDILNLIMFFELSCGLRYCTEFGALMVNYAPITDDMFKLAIINKFNMAAVQYDGWSPH